jgi:iron complex transport system permease protein
MGTATSTDGDRSGGSADAESVAGAAGESTAGSPLAGRRPWVRAAVWSAALAVVLVVTALASATVGPVSLDLPTVAKAAVNAVGVPTSVGVSVGGLSAFGLTIPVPNVRAEYTYLFDLPVDRTGEVIVRRIRLPRIALAAVVGFALAAAGTVMQGFFRNPMADPSIIGVSSGAAVGAVATMALSITGPFGLQLSAFCGAVLTAFAVYLIATEGGRTPVATLLLAGVAVQTFLGAVTSYLLLHAGQDLERAIYWLMGNLDNAAWDEVAVTAPVAVGGFIVLLAYARDLNVLLLGEEEAHTLGIEVERTKRILLAVSSVVTAAAVAVAGVIGFVGLVVPHMLRLVVGPDHRVLLPASAIGGAAFLVATDTVARVGAFAGGPLPVGIVTAALGAPFFLYLLRTREVHSL